MFIPVYLETSSSERGNIMQVSLIRPVKVPMPLRFGAGNGEKSPADLAKEKAERDALVLAMAAKGAASQDARIKEHKKGDAKRWEDRNKYIKPTKPEPKPSSS